MYVDWEYYKIFYYVAKYQNFTKAARVLGNNQPTYMAACPLSCQFCIVIMCRILFTHSLLASIITPQSKIARGNSKV